MDPDRMEQIARESEIKIGRCAHLLGLDVDRQICGSFMQNEGACINVFYTKREGDDAENEDAPLWVAHIHHNPDDSYEIDGSEIDLEMTRGELDGFMRQMMGGLGIG